MKFLIAAFVFFLTLGLTVKTIAEDKGATCNGEATAQCGAQTDGHAKAGHSHGDLSAKMNSLFPEKQNAGSIAYVCMFVLLKIIVDVYSYKKNVRRTEMISNLRMLKK